MSRIDGVGATRYLFHATRLGWRRSAAARCETCGALVDLGSVGAHAQYHHRFHQYPYAGADPVASRHLVAVTLDSLGRQLASGEKVA